MWSYTQTTGKMLRPDGTLAATGYSGSPAGINDPSKQSIHDVGPCPQGSYTMELITGPDGEAVDYDHKAKPVIRLIPSPKNSMFGRSGFLIHGDTTPPGHASLGCIIMPHNIRLEIQQSIDAGDAELDVRK
jgi:hypothetical protein